MSGFNPLSMFKPTGNPVVQKLLQNTQSNFSQLLDQQSFPTQFRKQNHQLLEKYMTYKKYEKLVQFITQIGDQNDKKRSYKYPFVAAQILSIENKHTEKYFISKTPIIEQEIVIQQFEIQQQVDSDLSFVSSRSQGSIVSDQSQAQKQSRKQEIEDINEMPQIQIEKRPSQINQDDFPFMEEIVKIKKVKQKRQKIIVHQYQPLFKRLIQYFSKPFNHTLTGYVCKVINAFLSSKKSIYSQILLEIQGSFFLTHLQSRSTEQLLVRILTFQNQDQNDIKLQYNLILLCLHKIFDEQNSEVIQNLSFLICQILSKLSNQANPSIHQKKLIKQLIKLTFFDKANKYFGQIIKKYLQTTKQNIKNKQIQFYETKIKQFSKIYSNFLQLYLKSSQKQDLKQVCLSVLNDYQDNFNQFVQTSYKKLNYEALNNINKKFNMTKIILINIVSTFIKKNLGFCHQILAEKNNFFNILLQLVQKYPLNNILHNSIFSIFEYLIQNLMKQNGVSVIGSLIRQVFETQSQYCFLKFCSQNFQQNKKLSIVNKKGYTGHLIKICNIINSIHQIKNFQPLNNFKQHKLWLKIVADQLLPYQQTTKKNLGNYFKKKNVRAQFQYDKAIILQNHKQFLKGTKFMSLDQFENFEEDGSQSDSQDLHNSYSRRSSRNSEQTQKQIQQMQMEQFIINSGIQTGNKQFIFQGQKTNDSINQNETN